MGSTTETEEEIGSCMKGIYKANLTAGGLLVSESRKIADLLLRSVNEAEWKGAMEDQNILQTRSKASGIRKGNLIRARLTLMTVELWEMIRDGDSTLATQATFASAIKHSRILGDYLDLVVRDQFRKMEEKLTPALWEEFVASCKQRDPLMKDFPPSTAKKMRTNVHNILREAGYLGPSRQLILQRVEIVPDLIQYLENNNEGYVLKCIQVSR